METDAQIYEGQRTPNKIDKSRSTPKHIVIEIERYSDKEKNIKTASNMSMRIIYVVS